MKPITILLSIFHGRIHASSFILFISICTVFLPATSVVQATTYYVSYTGKDGNLGKIGSPFITIQHGIDVLRAGDTLFVREGTYNEAITVFGHDGTENDPIVIMAYPGESPVIDGGITLPSKDYTFLVVMYEDYIYFDGFEVKNSNMLGTFLEGGGIAMVGNHCKVSNCKVNEIWHNGINAMGDYNIVEYCEVYRVALSNESDPGSAINGGGIQSSHGSDYTIFRHNIVHDVWGEAMTAGDATYVTIEDNIIYDGWSVNLYICNSQHCLVQRNLVYQTKYMTNLAPVGIGVWDEAVIPVGNSHTIINNMVYGCRRNFYTYGKFYDVLIANNTFINSTYLACAQIGSAANNDAIFANNIIIQEDNLPCIYAEADATVTFSHNLYNKSYDTDAVGTGDILDDPVLAKTGSKEAGKLTADYFKLLENSPAINKGSILSNIAQDYFGNLRVNSPDIGAHEYIVPVNGMTIAGAGGANIITSDKGTLQLSVEILPANATNKTVTWSIANGTGQATINSSGLVTAIANGTATATATATDGSGVSGTLVITISGQTVAVTGITITGAGNATTITTYGGLLQLSATVLPADATNRTVAWSIANGVGQASINSSGLVTAIANGTATVTATAIDGSGVLGTLVITISGQTVAVTGITVTGAGNTTAITTYGGILQLSAAVLPAEATNRTVTWSIANGTGQATINSSGLVTAIANGTVTAAATATDGSGVSGSLVITIFNQTILIESINVSPLKFASPVIKEKNGTLQMEADILPVEAKNFTIKWLVEPLSGNATIDDKGLLKGMSDGTVNVIATAMDGSNISGFCLVTIFNQCEVTDTAENGYQVVQLYNKLIITLNNKNTQIDFYSISTINGILINKEKVITDPIVVDLSSCHSGMYIVSLSGNQALIQLKIVIP